MPDSNQVFLAIDLGASGGRVVAGLFNGSQLSLEEVYRFDNGGIQAAGSTYWPLMSLWQHVTRGLKAAGKLYPGQVSSVGVDTWGVDFGLLGKNDELLGIPHHYRDRRTVGILDKAFGIVPREQIFELTGLQFMEFNTLYQLLAMKLAKSPRLETAQSFLMIPDLLHWLLTGIKGNEYTNATTTQFLNPRTRSWANDLFSRFGLPQHLLGNLVQPGTRLGKIQSAVSGDTGLSGVEVIVPGTHDTASAVAAVPASSKPGARPDWCYISSGTWSLMGVEVPEPVINQRCYDLNFTNEGGVGGTTRLLKNIPGLWLVQECRRVWKENSLEYGFEELTEKATKSPLHAALINPDHPGFVAPKDMPAAICEFCAADGQEPPPNEGAIIRAALESLALRYRQVLGYLEELVGGRIEIIHIVGGGAKDALLCQMTADATNRRVIAGPVEATALGNLAIQAIAHGAIGSIAQAREIIRASFEVQEYRPRQPAVWDEAYERFEKLVASG